MTCTGTYAALNQELGLPYQTDNCCHCENKSVTYCQNNEKQHSESAASLTLNRNAVRQGSGKMLITWQKGLQINSLPSSFVDAKVNYKC